MQNQNTNRDSIIRVIAGDGAIRAFFASTKETVERARQIHDTTPVATAALGRLLTGALIMGQMLKHENDLLTLQIRGDGLLGGVLATAGNNGRVKGYVNNPSANLPLKPNGKLDVSGAIGNGALTVIKDMGLKEPYVGQIPLATGEIAEDLTHYFAQSEQTPSAVALGVLVDRDYTVRQSGGFIIQLLPFADDKIIDKLESKIASLESVTEMLDGGLTAKGMMNEVLGDFGTEMLVEMPAEYYCNCSKERVEKALISIGKNDINKILDEDGRTELCCHFCGNKYEFSGEDLIGILKKI